MKSSLLSGLLVGAVAFCGAARAGTVNVVENGRFENPHVPTGSWDTFQEIPGWITTFGSGIEIQNRTFGRSPFDGDQYVELDAYANSGMKQTLPTVVGQWYELSFAFSPRPEVSSNSNGIAVYWSGVLLDEMTEDGIGLSDTIWTTKQYTVLATEASTDLAFWATGISDSNGGHVDNVRVMGEGVAPGSEVPEPSSLIAFASLSLAGIAAGAWRRRKEGAK